MKKITIPLRQHTPIIHFQHDQDGATLRATEVKPKLDKFIWEQWLTKAKNDLRAVYEKYKKCLIGYTEQNKEKISEQFFKNNFRSLDYKLHIASGKTEKYIICSKLSVDKFEALYEEYGNEYKIIKESQYFADNELFKKGDIQGLKKGVSSDKVEITIRTFNPEIQSFFNQNENVLPRFFAINNFGLRQSKGFGSFTVGESSISENQNYLKQYFKYKSDILIHNDLFNDANDIMAGINIVYKSLKRFVGRTPIESLIKEYFLTEKNITWEKSKIDEIIINNAPGIYPNRNMSNDPSNKYIRSMLGLAQLHDYPHTARKAKVMIEHTASSDEKIERFASPIIFKTFFGRIYMIANEVPESMKNICFKFFEKEVPDNYILLNTPDEFSISEFIEVLKDNNELNEWSYV